MSEHTETPTVVASGRTRPATLTTERAVARYLELRDKIDEIKKRQSQEMQPYTVALKIIGAWLLDDLKQANMESMRAAAGTVYKSVTTSAKVSDWPSVLEFIRDNNAWDLLERRVSKLVVQAIMEDTKQPIPGVETSQEVIINVRRT